MKLYVILSEYYGVYVPIFYFKNKDDREKFIKDNDLEFDLIHGFLTLDEITVN